MTKWEEVGYALSKTVVFFWIIGLNYCTERNIVLLNDTERFLASVSAFMVAAIVVFFWEKMMPWPIHSKQDKDVLLALYLAYICAIGFTIVNLFISPLPLILL